MSGRSDHAARVGSASAMSASTRARSSGVGDFRDVPKMRATSSPRPGSAQESRAVRLPKRMTPVATAPSSPTEAGQTAELQYGALDRVHREGDSVAAPVRGEGGAAGCRPLRIAARDPRAAAPARDRASQQVLARGEELALRPVFAPEMQTVARSADD